MDEGGKRLRQPSVVLHAESRVQLPDFRQVLPKINSSIRELSSSQAMTVYTKGELGPAAYLAKFFLTVTRSESLSSRISTPMTWVSHSSFPAHGASIPDTKET